MSDKSEPVYKKQFDWTNPNYMDDVNEECATSTGHKAWIYTTKIAGNTLALGWAGLIVGEGVGAIPGAIGGAVLGYLDAAHAVKSIEEECKMKFIEDAFNRSHGK